MLPASHQFTEFSPWMSQSFLHRATLAIEPRKIEFLIVFDDRTPTSIVHVCIDECIWVQLRLDTETLKFANL